jgi:hypothetical protein
MIKLNLWLYCGILLSFLANPTWAMYAQASNKKHSRIDIACTECQNRHQRCDNNNPCAFCQENNITCVRPIRNNTACEYCQAHHRKCFGNPCQGCETLNLECKFPSQIRPRKKKEPQAKAKANVKKDKALKFHSELEEMPVQNTKVITFHMVDIDKAQYNDSVEACNTSSEDDKAEQDSYEPEDNSQDTNEQDDDPVKAGQYKYEFEVFEFRVDLRSSEPHDVAPHMTRDEPRVPKDNNAIPSPNWPSAGSMSQAAMNPQGYAGQSNNYSSADLSHFSSAYGAGSGSQYSAFAPMTRSYPFNANGQYQNNQNLGYPAASQYGQYQNNQNLGYPAASQYGQYQNNQDLGYAAASQYGQYQNNQNLGYAAASQYGQYQNNQNLGYATASQYGQYQNNQDLGYAAASQYGQYQNNQNLGYAAASQHGQYHASVPMPQVVYHKPQFSSVTQ